MHMMFPPFPVLRFHPCDLVPSFPVLTFPVPRFQSPGPAPAEDIARSLHGRRSAAAASQQHGARQQMRRAVLRCQLTHEAERRRVKLTNIESIMQVVVVSVFVVYRSRSRA